jgi:hypothetical protein
MERQMRLIDGKSRSRTEMGQNKRAARNARRLDA